MRCHRAPNDRDVLTALVTMNAQTGNAAAASEYGARLQKLYPTSAGPAGGMSSGGRLNRRLRAISRDSMIVTPRGSRCAVAIMAAAILPAATGR